MQPIEDAEYPEALGKVLVVPIVEMRLDITARGHPEPAMMILRADRTHGNRNDEEGYVCTAQKGGHQRCDCVACECFKRVGVERADGNRCLELMVDLVHALVEEGGVKQPMRVKENHLDVAHTKRNLSSELEQTGEADKRRDESDPEVPPCEVRPRSSARQLKEDERGKDNKELVEEDATQDRRERRV
jgi:hypothetical protein